MPFARPPRTSRSRSPQRENRNGRGPPAEGRRATPPPGPNHTIRTTDTTDTTSIPHTCDGPHSLTISTRSPQLSIQQTQHIMYLRPARALLPPSDPSPATPQARVAAPHACVHRCPRHAYEGYAV